MRISYSKFHFFSACQNFKSVISMVTWGVGYAEWKRHTLNFCKNLYYSSILKDVEICLRICSWCCLCLPRQVARASKRRSVGLRRMPFGLYISKAQLVKLARAGPEQSRAARSSPVPLQGAGNIAARVRPAAHMISSRLCQVLCVCEKIRLS